MKWGEFKLELGLRWTARGWLLYIPSDVHIGGAIEKFGEYAETLALLLEKITPPGGVALDVGANIGALTLPMAESASRLLAFEPQPFVSMVLRANVAVNNLRNVECYRYVVADYSGVMRIPAYDLRCPSNTGGFGALDWKDSVEGVETKVVTIDWFELDRVDVMKVDVEGGELEVLLGARKTIERCRPVIVMECNTKPRLLKLIDWMGDNNYIGRWFVSRLYREGNFYESPVPEELKNVCSFDIIAVPEERDGRLEGVDIKSLPKCSPSDDPEKLNSNFIACVAPHEETPR